ncbi:hypothetical protein D3C79_982040 [compost metagenome]
MLFQGQAAGWQPRFGRGPGGGDRAYGQAQRQRPDLYLASGACSALRLLSVIGGGGGERERRDFQGAAVLRIECVACLDHPVAYAVDVLLIGA